MSRRKTRTADRLRAIRVFNNYGILERFGKPGDVIVDYTAAHARSLRPPASFVWSPFFDNRLDPPEGLETIRQTRFPGPRYKSLRAAREWAEKTFGPVAPSPHGGYVSARCLELAMKAIADVVLEGDGSRVFRGNGGYYEVVAVARSKAEFRRLTGMTAESDIGETSPGAAEARSKPGAVFSRSLRDPERDAGWVEVQKRV